VDRNNKKFITPFNYLEMASKKDRKSFEEMTLNEMDAYWEEAKRI
jgi:XTP/dITP diphosphohydrolase